VSQNDPFRIKLDSEPAADLRQAYADLERQGASQTPLPQRPANAPTPAPVAPVAAVCTPVPTETPNPDRPLSKYEEMCRARSLTIASADVNVITQFSQVIAALNDALRAAEKLPVTHPNVMPERMTSLIRDNLRECAQTMMKELHAMRNGRVQKKYDKRNVCCECHTVFLVPLPADNVCDACRAAKVPRSGPY